MDLEDDDSRGGAARREEMDQFIARHTARNRPYDAERAPNEGGHNG